MKYKKYVNRNVKKDENLSINSFDNNSDVNYPNINKSLNDDITKIFLQRNYMRTRKIRICSNCKTTETSIWRWSQGKCKLLCNACGLYEKTHRKNRPIAYNESGNPRILKKTEIFNNCVLCDAIITDILPEYKAFCFKCSSISDTIDVESFNFFRVDIRDKKKFGTGGRFYKFKLFDC